MVNKDELFVDQVIQQYEALQYSIAHLSPTSLAFLAEERSKNLARWEKGKKAFVEQVREAFVSGEPAVLKTVEAILEMLLTVIATEQAAGRALDDLGVLFIKRFMSPAQSSPRSSESTNSWPVQ